MADELQLLNFVDNTSYLDDSDEGVYEQQGGDGQTICDADDENLTPLLRVIKCAESKFVFNRRCVSSMLADLFRLAPADKLTEDLPGIMERFAQLMSDPHVIVRVDTLKRIPNLASVAMSRAEEVPALADVTSEHLLSMVVSNLGDNDNQLRRIAQRSLFLILEEGLISKAQIEIKVCPSILALTRKDPNKYCHTEGLVLMARLVPLLGKDIVERVFLDRFAELCFDSKFIIRKVCASHMGAFGAVVSRACFEKVLFTAYTKLCTDEVWTVRKACANVATSVSWACSPELRREVMAPLFDQLLNDKSRWVRISAFETLGPFISTFAEPAITSLSYNTMGDLVLLSNGSEFKIDSSPCCTPMEEMGAVFYSMDDLMLEHGTDNVWPEERNFDEIISESQENAADASIAYQLERVGEEFEECAIESSSTSNEPFANFNSNLNELRSTAHSGGTLTKPAEGNDEDTLELYNSYNYWYVPPDMPLDPKIVAGSYAEPLAIFAKVEDANESAAKLQTSDDLIISSERTFIQSDTSFSLHQDTDLSFISEIAAVESASETDVVKEPPQKIVPQLLIDHFISMTNPSIAENTEENIAYHCAYSLPAVALTLGSNNSHLLKGTVETLAANMQYRVRLTIASILHELAIIWGPDIASKYLTPIFTELMKDLDEVRIGVLKNLAHFLRLINPSKRSLYVPKLSFFLQNNQKLNWRYRYELAEQLLLAVPMFTPVECKHITRIAHRLLNDKIAAVRQAALQLLTRIVQHINAEAGLTSNLLLKIAESFAHSKKWRLRQTFVFLCAEFLAANALPMDRFACDVMPHLLDLSWDPVVNVRLVVARTIANHMIKNEYFHDPENKHVDTINSVLRRLQTDNDADVRQSALAAPCGETHKDL